MLADIKEHNDRVTKAKKIILKKKIALANQHNKKDKLPSLVDTGKLMVRPSKDEPLF